MREQDVCLELLLDWLADERGRRFEIERTEEPAPGVLAAIATDGAQRLAAEVHPLLAPTRNDAWASNRERLEGEIAAGLTGGYALWLPPGADLPAGGAVEAELLRLVREVASKLEPGQRADVPAPTTVYIKKQQDEGALMSVSGGLNRYWARLSEKARGTYDVDSTRLHRLPESPEHVERLCETVWERAAAIESVGQWAEIETVDAWTLQRLAGAEGFAIIGRPPEELADVGLAVRRNLRRLLAEAAPRLHGSGTDVKALVSIGCYAHMEDEGATTAMRGYDPALYAGLDFVCLAADGLVKALMESRVARA
ncbi:MAG TPA: hypothetical protein VJN32_05625 [Dehalococcoidia bacterium]|nr:hypothetical protein [Dehalococcoidia bacterium]